MEQPLFVDRREGAGDALPEREALAQRDRSAREPAPEVLALQPLHDEVRVPVLGAPVVDEPNHARVLDAPQDGHLAREPGRVEIRDAAHELDRHLCAAGRVDRTVHGARGPRPRLGLQPKASDCATLRH